MAKPRTPLRSTGRRAAATAGARRALNQDLIDRPRPCEAGPALRAQGVDVCTGRATCWHERRKRSSAGSTVNQENLVASCSRCNGAIEDEPAAARRAGLVAREGDPGWESLGRRADRQ